MKVGAGAASRLEWIEAESRMATESFAEAVAAGLSIRPKALPARFFYDAEGSRLFELITALPEYYPTRTERALIQQFAQQIVGALAGPIEIVEFGSGSSSKTRRLLGAALDQQSILRYVPIDINGRFLRESALRLLEDFDRLRVTGVVGEYRPAMASLPPAEGNRLFLFLGSNVGNFERGEAVGFLMDLARAMGPEDRAAIGIDLLKPRDVIWRAYNDSQGITARFNKNVLARVNRELDGEFDTTQFEHWAPFVEERSRVEMHLRSLSIQRVSIRALDLVVDFDEGETIYTESSHKYTREGFAEIAAEAGLEICNAWTDADAWFAEVLLRRQP